MTDERKNCRIKRYRECDRCCARFHALGRAPATAMMDPAWVMVRFDQRRQAWRMISDPCFQGSESKAFAVMPTCCANVMACGVSPGRDDLSRLETRASHWGGRCRGWLSTTGTEETGEYEGVNK